MRTSLRDPVKITFLIIFVLAGLLYASLVPQFKTGFFNDDAVYVLVARDLRHQAASQHLSSIKPDYPLPGFPVLLAPFAPLVKPHWTLLEWMSVLATLVALWILRQWAALWLGPKEVLFVVGLYAFNPVVAQFSGILMPAPYYTLVVLIVFLMLHRILERSAPLETIGLGFLLGWASLLRVEGGSLLASLAASLTLAPRKKEIYRYIAIPILFWGAVAVYWFMFRHMAHSDYAGDVGALLKYWHSHPAALFAFCWTFLRVMVVHVLMGLHLIPNGLSAAVTSLLIALCGCGIVAGFRALWRAYPTRRVELVAAAAFCGIYFAVHVVWHIALPRYGLALLPFVLVFFARGFSDWLSTHPYRKIWLGIVIVGIGASYGYSNGHAVFGTMIKPNPMNAPPWRALSWIRKNTPKTAKIMSPLSASIALYSNRTAVSLLRAPNEERFAYAVQKEGIDYIVDRPKTFVTPGINGTENLNKDWRRLRRWVQWNPAWFKMVFYDAVEKTSVYVVSVDTSFVRAFESYDAAFHDFRAGRPEESLREVSEGLKQYPEFGMAEDLLGAIYFSKKDYRNAESAFIKSAELLPDSPIPIINLASLYHRQGQIHRAAEVLNKALEIIAANGNTEARLVSLQRLMRSWRRNDEIIFF